MDTKKFTLLISALTVIVCVMTVVYNFASMPAYGNAEVSAVPLYAQGASGTSERGFASNSSSETSESPSAASSDAESSAKKTQEKSSETSADAKTSSGSSKKTAKTSSAAKATTSNPVNLNTATLEQLETVPYIGPARAQAIIDYRNAHGPFSSVDELDNVKGFGEKTIAKVKPYLTVN